MTLLSSPFPLPSPMEIGENLKGRRKKTKWIRKKYIGKTPKNESCYFLVLFSPFLSVKLYTCADSRRHFPAHFAIKKQQKKRNSDVR
jgi:hypothetical protein